MKRTLAVFLTLVCLLGTLLSLGASARELTHPPVTFTNSYATLTIAGAHILHADKEESSTVYGVPSDAEITVTITGAQENIDLYIGAAFSLFSKIDGTRQSVAEYILNADSALQQVYSADGNHNVLAENTAWVGASPLIRQNGNYHFALSAADYIGWTFTPLCGAKIMGGGLLTAADANFHGFLNGDFYGENESLVSFVVEKETGTAADFTDVAPHAYCYGAVHWATAHSITGGKTATTFAPNEICTNAQVFTFLWRASGSAEPTIPNPFTDVSAEHYYYKAALWASEQGLASGNTFYASAPCTRAMAMTYLWMLGGQQLAEKPVAFADVPDDAPYVRALAWAVERGITLGRTDASFAPNDFCTRGQIVAFIYRALAK